MFLSEITGALGGNLLGGDGQFTSVSIDTRRLRAGDLYVAIKGANFDGNDFVADAERNGACGAIVSHSVPVELPQLVVKDTTLALGQLAALNRQASVARVAGITGSQGKTTVKEMAGAILSVAGETLVTQGNLNNAIGVPLTLLQLNTEHRFGVIEMGANHGGEIAYSVNLVKPDVAIITNAARAHIEGFGSLEGVCKGKGEIIEGLGPDGTMVLNYDDRFFATWKERAGDRRVVSFSCENSKADYFASRIETDASGRTCFLLQGRGVQVPVRLALLGRHNVGNAVAAAALAIETGANLEQVRAGLESIRPVKGRLHVVDNVFGGRLIDDSYNASPESFKAAIDVLAELEGHRILLMGDMAELGSSTLDAHREIGVYARDAGVNELWAVGQASGTSATIFGQGGRQFEDKKQIVEHCKASLRPGVTLLIKGSRRAGLDEIVRALGDSHGV
ncbi:MAG: UDP-N-acetylmuramoyl-tripeptide--D-alanyl-D-alanine ligase [Gammaproteobacteria bacterium]|jgi:UDP-N-acetylmuramoyl-tripeptide--D-alanyl-D-alanine ligase